jgi:predicted O-methyltransferase YrrM
MELKAYPERFRELHELDDSGLSYLPTFGFGGRFINESHRTYSICPVQNDVLIDIGVDGWLRREDAMKLYELAYFCEGDILELGTYRGLSACILAQAIVDRTRAGRLGTLSERSARLTQSKTLGHNRTRGIETVDLNAGDLEIARNNIRARGFGDVVRCHRIDATTFCRLMIDAGRRFGMAFVDHSHEGEPVREACEHLSDLIEDGGFCLFHDYNDSRNRDPADTHHAVYQGVHTGLSAADFQFYGIFGCCGLFRRMSRCQSKVRGVEAA